MGHLSSPLYLGLTQPPENEHLVCKCCALVIRSQCVSRVIEIGYAVDQLGPAREESLALYGWDGIEWQVEATSKLDPEEQRVVATPTRLGLFALFGATNTLYTPIIMQNRPHASAAPRPKGTRDENFYHRCSQRGRFANTDEHRYSFLHLCREPLGCRVYLWLFSHQWSAVNVEQITER